MNLTRFNVTVGTLDIARLPHELKFAHATTATVQITTIDPAAAAYPLDGSEALILSIKKHEKDETPLISRQATITSEEDGEAEFYLTQDDRLILVPGYYVFDITLIRENGEQEQILPVSRLEVERTLYPPGGEVSVPGTQPPLGVGEQGPQGEPGEVGGLPDFSGTDGSVLVETGNPTPVAIWRRLTEDDILPGFSITAFSGAGGTLELGDTLANPSFTASYSSLPTTVTITDDTDTQSLNTPFDSFAYNVSPLPARSYTRTTIGVKSWTLSATLGVTDTTSVSEVWAVKAYYGIATPGTYNSAFVTALPGNAFVSGLARTIALTGASGKHGFYWVPTMLGAITLSKDAVTGFAVPVEVVATITFNNAHGVSVTGDLYMTSDEILTDLNWLVS